jgi:hypothetical protein
MEILECGPNQLLIAHFALRFQPLSFECFRF